jgi:hypothetical protein|tara:strand:+ start:228 stop:998 length:771 start_codon:yes stop_codon:yes gene_type:complete
MKSLIKRVLKNQIIYKIRNKINFKPVKINLEKNKLNSSVSDAFLWRCDKNFKTIFKYTDLLSLFYNDENHKINIIFFDSNNNKIKEINNLDIISKKELLIDEDILNGQEGYGTFYVFHNSKTLKNISVRNSCYTGYSYKKNLYSFVHGNLPTKYSNLENSLELKDNIIYTNSIFENQKYFVQNDFSSYDRVEVFFVNASKDILRFTINEKKYVLNYNHSKIVELHNINKIIISSNSYLLRPIIFIYKNDFIDVQHG